MFKAIFESVWTNYQMIITTSAILHDISVNMFLTSFCLWQRTSLLDRPISGWWVVLHGHGGSYHWSSHTLLPLRRGYSVQHDNAGHHHSQTFTARATLTVILVIFRNASKDLCFFLLLYALILVLTIHILYWSCCVTKSFLFIFLGCS